MKTKLLFKVVFGLALVLFLYMFEAEKNPFMLFIDFVPLTIIMLASFIKDAFDGIKQEVNKDDKIKLIVFYTLLVSGITSVFVSIKLVLLDFLSLEFMNAVTCLFVASLVGYLVAVGCKKLKDGTKVMVE